MTTSIIRGLLILTLLAVGAFGLPLSAHAKSGDPAGTASHGQIQPTKTWLMQMIVQEAGKTNNVTPIKWHKRPSIATANATSA